MVDFLDPDEDWADDARKEAAAMREVHNQFWDDRTDQFCVEMGTAAFMLAFADWIVEECSYLDPNGDDEDRLVRKLRKEILQPLEQRVLEVRRSRPDLYGPGTKVPELFQPRS